MSLDLAPGFARLGTETAFEVLARAEALATAGRSVVNLGIGQPDFRTPEHVVDAAVRALADGHHGYTPAAGIRPLREAIAADIAQRRDVEVDPDQVVVVPGGKVTMFTALLMLGQPGVEILHPDPGFPIYASMIRFTGATAVPYVQPQALGFAFNADAVLERITPATRLIIVNSPGNPTGGVVPEATLAALARGIADRPDICVLSDEIYSRILYGGATHVSLLRFPELTGRVILLDGFSKTYAMTGWRLGYAVWPPALVEPAVRLAVNAHSCVNAAAQWAGIAALTGPQDAVEAMVEQFAQRRRLIVDGLNALPGVRCAEPGGAFYVFPDISGTGMDARTLQRRLLEDEGVATIAGTSFGAAGEGHLRLSYAASAAAISEALKRLERLLRVGA